MRRAVKQPIRAARRRLKVAGYTIIEIMMAMTMLSIGATGIIALQKATLVGNVRARNLEVATAIASTWIDRLRLDALQWTINADATSTIAGTTWLNAVGNDFPLLTPGEGAWFRPAAVAGISAAADVAGHDTTVNAATGFCTHLRVTQLLNRMIRVEVRVFWLKRQGLGIYNTDYGGTLNAQPLCSADPTYVAGVGAERMRYHFIYMTSGVLANTLE